jgi:hypothetical protein
MSSSRLSSGDAAKTAKQLKNLKSNVDELKSENDKYNGTNKKIRINYCKLGLKS